MEKLINVPSVELFESFTSWLTRTALSQGTDYKTLLTFFGLDTPGDKDLLLTAPRIQTSAIACGLKPNTFSFMQHMFQALKSIDPTGEIFLLGAGKLSRYRYCPVCLQEQRCKSYPVHWRFKAWRYCPLHDCMMEDRCTHCGLSVDMPQSLISFNKNKHVVSLDQCVGCEKKISSHWMKVKSILKSGAISDGELEMMARGRAVLSSLFHGYYVYENAADIRHSIRGLRNFAKYGNLPHHGFFLDNNELLRRR